MSSEKANAFESASVEFTTPDKVYCSYADCAQFIAPPQIQTDISLAHCIHCGTDTCSRCKECYRPGECQEDDGIKEVLELAKLSGWQRCPQCKTMVELDHGCYHMT
jgi:hypothetical protein